MSTPRKERAIRAQVVCVCVCVCVCHSSQVELQPTLQSLFDTIQKVSRNLITVIQAVPRIALQLTDKQVRSACSHNTANRFTNTPTATDTTRMARID